ncbi:substrate-binding domain-containing protein [Acetivibrio cellulolyticus]|uniref:substrate-binding domain-containing protein n=1 Tax=Acetivibrio cellulolyticus TaxID=35830 RepID=UPI0002481C0F|nr:substrate-binding domain-containing protein [Acetivibrio cellulolyticus]
MKKRKTLGLLINDIDGSYQTYLWLMLKQAAEEMDCNLLVFVGRSLKYDSYADKQHHIVYNFIDKEIIDGLIIASTSIANFITYDEFLRFCKKYSDIPIVSFGIEIPGAVNLFFDNKQGMKDLVTHLINDHCYKRIIFVKGTENNYDAIERFEAYKEVLTENNIDFDESLVFSGDFSPRTGYKIMEEVILSNTQYDAIVFSNDDMALGALRCLKHFESESKIDFNKKCIICGFDDTMTAKKATPPLTTVRQPIKEMCYTAIELLVNGIADEDKGKKIVLPAVMVKRASCGCSYSTNEEESIDNNTVKLVAEFRVHENLQTYMIDELLDKLTSALEKCFVYSCFVYKYLEGPIFYDVEMAFDESFNVPLQSEMIYAYYDGARKELSDNYRIIKTTRIVPECFIPEDRRFSYLAMPLFFGNEHFGFVSFDITDGDMVTFELLRGQISNTLKGALMLVERENMAESLMEKERLASLGQLIGGISHNLMTPIMSIGGVCTALQDLIDENMESVGDTSVTKEDFYEIGSEMTDWVKKLKDYNAYMSNVISNVKSQAVQLNSQSTKEFTIEEFVNRIMFLIRSDISIMKNVDLHVDTDKEILVSGDISNIMQVLNNLIKNAIQSYEGSEIHSCKVDLYIRKKDNMIIIIVKDYGKGISEEIKPRIFKNMVTTKGKDGTGLSLLLSYSTIKGKFGGDIWFESKQDQGTEFYIAIPIL